MTQRFFEWFVRQPALLQAAIFGLYFGFGMASFGALGFGKAGAALAGFVIGLIMGVAYCFRERRDPHSWLYLAMHDDGSTDDYPADLEAVERRYAGYDMIMFPGVFVVGIAASWILLGVGYYGAIVAFPAALGISWILNRFGPGDPKWRTVREDWMRRHGEIE